MKIFKLMKRWINMMNGKSIYHIKQGKGKYYSKTSIRGYYNDLTGKSNAKNIDSKGIPVTTTISGIKAYFPIEIFQYGLGLYDLYIEKNNSIYLKKFLKIADWAVDNIDNSGMWDCMNKLGDKKHLTQSSMCQSEGISILLRAYVQTNSKKYLKTAEKAVEFMIKSIDDGGTCLYDGNNVIFQEYVSSEVNLSVLNGWIFSIFGLLDYTIYTNNEKYIKLLNSTITTLANTLYKYDRKFWSNYDQKKTIASPAYHDIHIMQLEILYDIFNIEEFKQYSLKWKKCQKNCFYKSIAILIKLKQKIFRNKYYDINTSTIEVNESEDITSNA